jgi:ribosomal protein S18 acetylase RimI-like enzyme
VIIPLDNTKLEIGKQIRSLFQVSYKIEAALLKADDFPPLKRPLKDFLNCENEFYGYENNQEIVAIVELKYSGSNCHVQSLVVHPNYFRKGFGKNLMHFVLQKMEVNTFTIETGFDNFPARQLYKSLGFKENGDYDTVFGIKKIKFILEQP